MRSNHVKPKALRVFKPPPETVPYLNCDTTLKTDSSSGQIVKLEEGERCGERHTGQTSSVATGGHGWARAHPAPAVLGHGIRADPKSFFRG